MDLCLFIWALGQDKLERKSVWACKSESEGGAKKREVLERLKMISTVKSYLTHHNLLLKEQVANSAPVEENKVS